MPSRAKKTFEVFISHFIFQRHRNAVCSKYLNTCNHLQNSTLILCFSLDPFGRVIDRCSFYVSVNLVNYWKVTYKTVKYSF